jgi:hypothetical protein
MARLFAVCAFAGIALPAMAMRQASATLFHFECKPVEHKDSEEQQGRHGMTTTPEVNYEALAPEKGAANN